MTNITNNISKETKKHYNKAKFHRIMAHADRGIIGRSLSTLTGVCGGIDAAAIAVALLPGGTQTKDAVRALVTLTVTILGYDYSKELMQGLMNDMAVWHAEKAYNYSVEGLKTMLNDELGTDEKKEKEEAEDLTVEEA